MSELTCSKAWMAVVELVKPKGSNAKKAKLDELKAKKQNDKLSALFK